MYKGEDREENLDKTQLYTFQILSRRVQASDEELLEKLREMAAFQLNGTCSNAWNEGLHSRRILENCRD
jgi:hypothetical protein